MILIGMVPLAGLEPALLAELDFESSASTNFTTGARGRRGAIPAARRCRSPLPQAGAFSLVGKRHRA